MPTMTSLPGEMKERTGNRNGVERGMSMSITFRWLLPGADVVGDAS